MKCSLCGKEFPENTTDITFFYHMIENHKKEVVETGKNMKKELVKNKKVKSQ